MQQAKAYYTGGHQPVAVGLAIMETEPLTYCFDGRESVGALTMAVYLAAESGWALD